jgi:hypothetical protein
LAWIEALRSERFLAWQPGRGGAKTGKNRQIWANAGKIGINPRKNCGNRRFAIDFGTPEAAL